MKMRKLMAVLLIMIFLVPISAMASTTTQTTDKTTQATTIKVGDVINGEEVLWVSTSTNLGQNDVAYVTGVKTEKNTISPLGDVYNYDRSFTVTARNCLLVKLFWTRAQAHWHFQIETKGWHCYLDDTGSDYGVYSSLWQKHEFGVTFDWNTFQYVNPFTAQGYFHLKSQPSHIGHAWACITLVGHMGFTIYQWGTQL